MTWNTDTRRPAVTIVGGVRGQQSAFQEHYRRPRTFTPIGRINYGVTPGGAAHALTDCQFWKPACCDITKGNDTYLHQWPLPYPGCCRLHPVCFLLKLRLQAAFFTEGSKHWAKLRVCCCQVKTLNNLPRLARCCQPSYCLRHRGCSWFRAEWNEHAPSVCRWFSEHRVWTSGTVPSCAPVIQPPGGAATGSWLTQILTAVPDKRVSESNLWSLGELR